MSFPEDAIQLCSVVVAGIFAQLVPNSRCALMIVANTIVLIGAVLVDSKYNQTHVYQDFDLQNSSIA
jgi:ACS family allantoate permease-like MFS transporter